MVKDLLSEFEKKDVGHTHAMVFCVTGRKQAVLSVMDETDGSVDAHVHEKMLRGRRDTDNNVFSPYKYCTLRSSGHRASASDTPRHRLTLHALQNRLGLALFFRELSRAGSVSEGYLRSL